MTTNQEERQEFFRAGAGVSSGTYNENLMQNAAADSITASNINEAFALWLQNRTNTSKTNINDLKAEFARLHGVDRWSDVGYSPLLLRGLILWLESANTSSGNIVESGNLVSQWNDKSGQGNNATQGTGGAQPTTNTRTINTKNALDFDGSSDNMQVSGFQGNLSESTASEIFIVFKMDVASGVQKTLLSSTVSGTDRFFMGVNINQHLMCATYDGAFTRKTVSFTDTASPHILNMSHSAANAITAYLDAVEMTLTTETPATSTTATTRIGARSSGDLWWNGLISEVIVYNRQLSAAERTAIETYLSNKWGVTI